MLGIVDIGYFVSLSFGPNYILLHQSQAFAISTPFPQQEIIDDQHDWINMTSRETSTNGDPSTDILAVDYFSDGHYLNATLWLYSAFIDSPINYNQVNYGMLIDGDFNNSTGYGGIDYLFQIGWSNSTKSWTERLNSGRQRENIKL